MEFFYLYLIGCAADAILLVIHLIFGYVTISSLTIKNHKKVGLHVSYLGDISLTPKGYRTLIIDIFLSWIAVAMNIFALASRILHYVSFLFSPEENRKIAYNVANYELTTEEVIVLQLKARASIAGLKFTAQEIQDEFNDSVRWQGIKVDEAKLFELLESNNLLKKAS